MFWLPPTPTTRLVGPSSTVASWRRWLERNGYAGREAEPIAAELFRLASDLRDADAPASEAVSAAVALLSGRPPASVAALPTGPPATLSPEQLAGRLRPIERVDGSELAVDVLTGVRWRVTDYGTDRASQLAVFASAVLRYVGVGVAPIRRVAWATGTAGAHPELTAWTSPTDQVLEAWREETAADVLVGYIADATHIRGRRHGPVGGEPLAMRAASGLAFVFGYTGPETDPAALSPSAAFNARASGRARAVLEAVAKLSDAQIDASARYAGLASDDPAPTVIRSRRNDARVIVG